MTRGLSNVIPLLFFTVMGFYSVSTQFNSKNIEDWIGTYELVAPNLIERQILLKKNKVQRSFFSMEEKEMSLSLKEDFTFVFYRIKNNKDTVFYYGIWEMLNEKPLLHFKTYDSSLEKLSFAGKVYYKDYLIPCQDTIKRDLRINVFKKVK